VDYGKENFPMQAIKRKIFMTFGLRLREERERLGMSQPRFAGLAGTTKQTLFSWESGKTAPDGFQLAAMAAEGVDVLYVITGMRSGVTTLRDGEATLLEGYRALDARGKAGVMGLIGGMAPHPPAPGMQVQVHGGSGHVVGQVTGTVNMAPAAVPVRRARVARKSATGS